MTQLPKKRNGAAVRSIGKAVLQGDNVNKSSAEFRGKMAKKMRTEGWDNIKQFMISTRVPFSLETVRRAFNTCDYKNIEVSTLAIIMKHLNFTPNEIRAMLTKCIGDNNIVSLIGDSNVDYTIQEQRLVEAYRMIVSKNPKLSGPIADQIVWWQPSPGSTPMRSPRRYGDRGRLWRSLND